MASPRSPRSAPRAAATCCLIFTKLAAMACILLLMICGSSLLKGDNSSQDRLLLKSFSMVSFDGIAAKEAGATPPYLVKMHVYLNSFGWEWLNTTSASDAAGYAYIEPARPLHMPTVLHDVADVLRRTMQMTRACQSQWLKTTATSVVDPCVRESRPFFAAFDSTSPLTLQTAPAFALYVAAIVVNCIAPAVFSCLKFFRDGRVNDRWRRAKAAVLALPLLFHAAAASLLTANAARLVAYLTRFPDVPTDASIGFRFLVIAWCGVLAELLAVFINVVRIRWFPPPPPAKRRSVATVRGTQSGSRIKVEESV